MSNLNSNGYYISQCNPKIKIPLEPNDFIYLCDMDLIELVLPQCKKIYCRNNFLTKLIVPEGCEVVDCQRNKLISLNIPQSCIRVSCHTNNLIELILPHSCTFVDCGNNYLTELVLPQGCIEFYYDNNNLHPIIKNLLGFKDPVKIALANSLQVANNLQR
jgi:hypothetical protein